MSFLTSTGAGVVDRLAYVGGLTIQCIKGVRAIPRILPIMGKRGRWNAAIRQLYAIGVAAVPMVAIVGACAGLILAIQSATVLNQLPGTAALFGGITVGRVSTVRPDTTDPTRIEISLEVSQSTPLNGQSVAEVGSVSPMSAPVLTISTGSKSAPRLALGATIPSQEALSMDDLQRKVAVLADTAQTALVQVTGDLNGTSDDTRKQLANLAGRLLYLSYALVDRLFWLDALKDQIAAGAFMWVFGSLMFLVPAIYLTARLMTNGRLIDEKTGLERARALAQ